MKKRGLSNDFDLNQKSYFYFPAFFLEFVTTAFYSLFRILK
jgi:hypothetical protein